jgi:hypothetical protein
VLAIPARVIEKLYLLLQEGVRSPGYKWTGATVSMPFAARCMVVQRTPALGWRALGDLENTPRSLRLREPAALA